MNTADWLACEFKCAFCGTPFWTDYDLESGDQDQVYCDDHDRQVLKLGYAETKRQWLSDGNRMYKR